MSDTKVKCPLCGHIFKIDETFQWDADEYNHPTIESIYCPKCGVGTYSRMSCDICPGSIPGTKYECSLADECAACLYFNFEDFKEVTEEQAK